MPEADLYMRSPEPFVPATPSFPPFSPPSQHCSVRTRQSSLAPRRHSEHPIEPPIFKPIDWQGTQPPDRRDRVEQELVPRSDFSISISRTDPKWAWMLRDIQDICLAATQRYIHAHNANEDARIRERHAAATAGNGSVRTPARRYQARFSPYRERQPLRSPTPLPLSCSIPVPSIEPPDDNVADVEHNIDRASGRDSESKEKIHSTDSLLSNAASICNILWRPAITPPREGPLIVSHIALEMADLLSYAENVALREVRAERQDLAGGPAGDRNKARWEKRRCLLRCARHLCSLLNDKRGETALVDIEDEVYEAWAA